MDRGSSRPDSDRELTGSARSAVVAALARMVVAELEREHLLRSAPPKPETTDSKLSTTESALSTRADETQ
jgi:hypothetical protein